MRTRIFIFLVFIICLIHEETFHFLAFGLEKDMNSEVQKVKEISINEPDAIEANIENQPDIFQFSSLKDNTLEAGDGNFVTTENYATSSLDGNGPETLLTEHSEVIQKSLESTFNHQDLREPENKVEQFKTGNKLEKTGTDIKVEISETDSKVGISETDSKVQIPETDSKVDKSETDSKFGIPETDSKVETSQTDSKVDISEIDSKVDISEIDSKVDISEIDSKVDISEIDSKVDISEIDSKVGISETDSKGELNETDCKSKSEKSQTETLADQPEECTSLNSGQTENVLVRAEEESKAESLDFEIEDVEMIDDDRQNGDEESAVEEGSNNKGQDKETVIESGELITNEVAEALVESPLETLPSNPEETLPSSCTSETLEIQEEETREDMGQCMGKDHKSGECSDEDGDNKRKKQSTIADFVFAPRENEAKAGKKKKRDDQEDITVRNRPTNRDTEQYRLGYPGKKDNPNLNANKEFYFGEIKSEPDGAFIDEIHQDWFGNYNRLEQHHGYIQWIFPIREEGMNWRAQPLQPHEAKAIKDDPKAKQRVLKSYHMMLDFYGMELDEQGVIKRSKNYRQCFRNLTNHTHNYLRITRMLKSLGELGYEELKKPFLEFILKEALLNGRLLKSTLTSCENYWIGTLKSEKDRESLYRFIDEPEKHSLSHCK